MGTKGMVDGRGQGEETTLHRSPSHPSACTPAHPRRTTHTMMGPSLGTFSLPMMWISVKKATTAQAAMRRSARWRR